MHTENFFTQVYKNVNKCATKDNDKYKHPQFPFGAATETSYYFTEKGLRDFLTKFELCRLYRTNSNVEGVAEHCFNGDHLWAN